ncbi:MAG: hypothetical protein KBT34_01345 [Prevotella sp.]|nr:hypothetical protein [Candidatus Prevotella equi]
MNNVANKSISEEFLAVAKANRNKVYPHVLDLYFEPVEMSVQPTLNWCSGIALTDPETLEVTPTVSAAGLTNTTIGVFVAGGNRGNMNVEPWNGSTANYGGNVAETGQIINYQFPSGLTITNRIVGGCNEANYTLGKVTHVGGYLLGGREHDGTEINLLVECQFAMPQGMTSLLSDGKPLTDSEGNPVEQRNVYGGCYKSGTIYGDIDIDFRSSMLTTVNAGDPVAVAKAYFGSEVAMGNVYGAGYGPESYVYGDTKVTVNPNPVNIPDSSAKGINNTQKTLDTVDNDAYAAMSVYGGGQQGNVIGNTTVRILNGHIGKSAVGGSYAGYMWGSTQVLVGYPSYYTAQNGGKYKMFRADKWNVGADYKNADGSDVVKQEIYLMPGDIVSEEVFNAIKAYDTKNSTSQATTGAEGNFSAKVTETPAGGWDGINIVIDEATYGGGYSLASGSSVAAGTYTVKKYDETMNLDGDYKMSLLTTFVNDRGNSTTRHYGGNTTVLVWDNNDRVQENDHIKISTQTMKQVTPEEGADLFGYYVKENKNGVEGYRYIYQEGEYFYTKLDDQPAQYFKQAFESDSEGGMYGDGHLSFAEGFRTGELVGYGFAGYRPNGALVINTFQRMDILRIKDCAVAVLGARDYTVNEVSTTPYSLARISELHMEAQNVTNFGSGALAATSERHSRNYLGLSNNIHYVGAVNSNVDFNATYHYGNKDEEKTGGDKHLNGTEGSGTYREAKQAYVDDYKTKQNDAEFQKRNDGTAANMIGISSGYAMKVQNVKTTNAKGEETYFYGPIVGVVEMNLIDVREDEGGGYVYADNIHHRSSTAMNYSNPNYNQVPGASDAAEDFLETSGNFVFPYDKVKNRYIVDDCFPTGYPKDATQATAEAHYWYVTGYNYYYNAHITGYTYNSESQMLSFDSDNDNLLTLTGAKAGQQIALQSLKWRSLHPTTDGFEKCDLETPKKKDEVEQTTGKGNNASSTTNGHFIYDHYNLFVGTANASGKFAIGKEVTPANGTDINTGYYTDEACTIPATGTADGEKKYYQNTMSYWANLPLTENLSSDSNRKLTNSLASESPTLAFQLTDNVDNSGNDYFQKYMAQPCDATIVFTCPATEADGETPIKGYVPISYFFTRSGTEPNYTYTKMADNTQLTAGTVYYYFGNGNDYHAVNSDNLYYYHKSQQRYVPIGGDAALAADRDATYYTTVEEYNDAKSTSLTADQFAALSEAAKVKTPAEKAHDAGEPITAAKLVSGSSEYTFYAYADRVYTYTIYLTIDYVQGPDVTGNIKIYNCALPGEKIKIDKGTVTISSDVSMSQESTIWKIGEWRFDQAHPYDPTADVNTTDEMLKDVEYSEQDNCIYVPAYYFMNGYPVQYLYTVNGIPDEFYVPANENGQDKLTIHNYHRMKPRNADGVNRASVDFKLDEALKRINAETDTANAMPEATEEERTAKAEALKAILPEPRIYIADAADLNELPRFIGEKKVTAYYTLAEYNSAKSKTLTADEFYALPDAERVKTYGAVGSKYDFGNHMQFHLLDNIVVNNVGIANLQGDHYADKGEATDFNGTLNGNGYVISDLGVKKGEFTAPTYLFAANHGNIYNLGLKQGVITSGDTGANNSLYHTSYTWSNKTVYRMDGTAVGTTADGAGNTYTENDWRYGKVTYDLNQYYLEARKAKLNSTADAQHYVEDLFHNGDYLYARWKTASSEYLRTADASKYDANYNSQTTYHYYTLTDGVLTHPVDESRAVGYNAETKAYDNYAPLFEEAKKSETATSTTVKNDFLFFGQTLDADTKGAGLGVINQTIPEHIDSDVKHDVSLMNNRVYRAGGYYKSNVAYMKTGKAEDRYDTNAGAFFYNRAAYAHDNGITAIDFYGYPEESDKTWYAPMVDYPTVNLASMDRADGVTRNLLVYANSETEVTTGALTPYVYNESTPEGNIKMHVIKPVVTAAVAPEPAKVTPTTAYLHLVERTAESKDAEGNTCLNNDFDAPIAFDVTQRAWYTRQPAYYAETNNSAWEGITLPFTAKKVEASLNGEITHFYGTPTEAQKAAPETNDKTLHHEYWLRGLVGMDASKTVANFQRPGSSTTETTLFGTAATDAAAFSYVFNNHWFKDTYTNNYNWDDASNQNKWYSDEAYPSGHTYTDYKPLTADIPYIVSFPGNRYYEFDLSSKFYNDMLNATEKAQTVTFSNDVPEDASITIGTTNVQYMQTIDESDKAHTHRATYVELAKSENIYAISNNGTQFEADAAKVLPFRTYMAEAATLSLAKEVSSGPQLAKGGLILIGSANAPIEKIENEYGVEDSEEKTIDGMRIYPRGNRIIVESSYATTINIYTAGGQLVRIVDVRPGVNTYSGFQQGIYIAGYAKVYVK